MRRIVIAALLWLWPAVALACSANPVTLQNGTTADASQVMQNFNNLLNCINAVVPGATGSTTLNSGLTIPSPTLTGTANGLTLSGPATVTDAELTLGNFSFIPFTSTSQGFLQQQIKTNGIVSGCGASGCNYNLLSNADDETQATGSGINYFQVQDLVNPGAAGNRTMIVGTLKLAFTGDNTALNNTQNGAIQGYTISGYGTGKAQAITAGITMNSTTMTSAASLGKFTYVTGTGIPYGTFITSNSNTAPYTLSQAATATNAAASLTAFNNTVSSTTMGAALFASNFVTTLGNNGTGVNTGSIIGSEVDMAATSGTAPLVKMGWEVITLGTDAVQGSSIDAAYVAAADGAVGWHYGYQLGTVKDGWPLDPTNGIAFGVQQNQFGNFSGTMAAAYGVSFVDPQTGAAVSFSKCAFYSTGICIDGSGVLKPSPAGDGLLIINAGGEAGWQATGPDTNINMKSVLKGSGSFFIGSNNSYFEVHPDTNAGTNTKGFRLFAAIAADVPLLQAWDFSGGANTALAIDATTLTLGLSGGTSQILSGTVSVPAIASDSTHTDATVCEDTTTHVLLSGSGAAGICLGTSSLRYKHDVAALPRAMADRLMDLRPIGYRYNEGYGDNGARRLYGFAAEQVFGVLPELVGLDREGRPNSVDWAGLVPLIVKKLQDQQHQIDRLKERL